MTSLRNCFIERFANNSQPIGKYENTEFYSSEIVSYYKLLKSSLNIKSPQDTILFITSPSIESIYTAFFLILSPVNTIFTSIDQLKSDKEWLSQLNIASIILSSNDHLDFVSEFKDTYIQVLSSLEESAKLKNNENLEQILDVFNCCEDHLSTFNKVFLSSGSTGTPKLIPLNYNSINACFLSLKKSLFKDAVFQDILCLHDPSFVIVLPFLFCFSIAPHSCICAPSNKNLLSPIFWCKSVINQIIKPMLISVPSAFRLLIKLSILKNDISRFHLISCGEPLDSQLALLLSSLSPHSFYNLYGSTEVSPWIIYLNVLDFIKSYNSNIQPILPTGSPLPSVNWLIKETEMLINSPSMFNGYLNISNADTFEYIQGIKYFRTGDAFHICNGLLYCNGRLNTACKILGKFINPTLVETSLRSRYPSNDFLVVPKEALMRVNIFSFGDPIPETEMISYVKSVTFPEIIANIFYIKSSAMKLPSGKIDRKYYAML